MPHDHMMRRMSSQPQHQMYVTEAPGVATMHAYQQVPRHAAFPFSVSDAGMNASLQSSPEAPASRSPVGEAYTFQSAQAATHALQSAEQHQHNMGHFHPATTQSMMAMPHQHVQAPVTHDVYHQQHATSGPAPVHVSSFDNNNLAAYQPPMNMTHVSVPLQPWGLPIFGGFKVEDEMPLPTHRMMQDGSM